MSAGHVAETELTQTPPRRVSKTGVGGIAADQLRSIVERVERLEEEKVGIAADISDLFMEAKGNGYDVKTLRKVIALRKQEPAERDEAEFLLDTYKSALGMKPQMDMFEEEEAAFESEEDAELYKQAVGIVVRDQRPSTSYVQRMLHLGYNQAATLLDRMEKERIVSPANHGGKREVLATYSGVEQPGSSSGS